jgi:hypothetical protein
MWLSESLDGMPGRRRNWIAERRDVRIVDSRTEAKS